MQPGLEQLIRERAYALWQEEGRPDGRAEEHWQMAERAVRSATSEEAPPATEKKTRRQAAPKRQQASAPASPEGPPTTAPAPAPRKTARPASGEGKEKVMKGRSSP